MRRPWFPNPGEPPTLDADETDAEREGREDAERSLYAEQDAAEYDESLTREAEAEEGV